MKKVFLSLAFILFGALALFFVFYEVRLLYVTHFLTQVRKGGQGTYIGSVVFPLLALGFGWIASMSLRRARQD
jgi:hypothetical protein